MKFNQLFDFVLKLPGRAVIRLIKLYQVTLSPDHSWRKSRYPYGFCRFYPSCSEYAVQAIKKRGLVVGFFMSVWRVLRCNPWSKGGTDLP